MKNIIQEFPLVIYPCKVAFAIGEEFEKEINQKYELLSGNPIELSRDAMACTFSTVDRSKKAVFLIWVRRLKDITVSMITHESVHAAMNVCAYTGVVPDTDNQEPVAYLAGYVATMFNYVWDNAKKAEEDAEIADKFLQSEACTTVR